MFQIVETMSYNADVASFMEVIGSFYEYIDVPGKHITDDSSSVGKEDAVVAITSHDSDSEDDNIEHQEVSIEEIVNDVAASASSIIMSSNCQNECSSSLNYSLSESLSAIPGKIMTNGTLPSAHGSNGIFTNGYLSHRVSDLGVKSNF